MRFSERVGRLACKTAQAEDAAIPSFRIVVGPPKATSNWGRTLRRPPHEAIIMIGPTCDDATVIHEYLHLIHPDWPEARVEARCREIAAAV